MFFGTSIDTMGWWLGLSLTGPSFHLEHLAGSTQGTENQASDVNGLSPTNRRHDRTDKSGVGGHAEVLCESTVGELREILALR